MLAAYLAGTAGIDIDPGVDPGHQRSVGVPGAARAARTVGRTRDLHGTHQHGGAGAHRGNPDLVRGQLDRARSLHGEADLPTERAGTALDAEIDPGIVGGRHETGTATVVDHHRGGEGVLAAYLAGTAGIDIDPGIDPGHQRSGTVTTEAVGQARDSHVAHRHGGAGAHRGNPTSVRGQLDRTRTLHSEATRAAQATRAAIDVEIDPGVVGSRHEAGAATIIDRHRGGEGVLAAYLAGATGIDLDPGIDPRHQRNVGVLSAARAARTVGRTRDPHVAHRHDGAGTHHRHPDLVRGQLDRARSLHGEADLPTERAGTALDAEIDPGIVGGRHETGTATVVDHHRGGKRARIAHLVHAARFDLDHSVHVRLHGGTAAGGTAADREGSRIGVPGHDGAIAEGHDGAGVGRELPRRAAVDGHGAAVRAVGGDGLAVDGVDDEAIRRVQRRRNGDTPDRYAARQLGGDGDVEGVRVTHLVATVRLDGDARVAEGEVRQHEVDEFRAQRLRAAGFEQDGREAAQPDTETFARQFDAALEVAAGLVLVAGVPGDGGGVVVVIDGGASEIAGAGAAAVQCQQQQVQMGIQGALLRAQIGQAGIGVHVGVLEPAVDRDVRDRAIVAEVADQQQVAGPVHAGEGIGPTDDPRTDVGYPVPEEPDADPAVQKIVLPVGKEVEEGLIGVAVDDRRGAAVEQIVLRLDVVREHPHPVGNVVVVPGAGAREGGIAGEVRAVRREGDRGDLDALPHDGKGGAVDHTVPHGRGVDAGYHVVDGVSFDLEEAFGANGGAGGGGRYDGSQVPRVGAGRQENQQPSGEGQQG